MRTAIIGVLLLATAATGQEQRTQFPPTLTDPVLDLCTVKVKRELLMPAKDNGALVSLAVEVGDVVEQGAVMGQIDDKDAVAAQAVARAELETAHLNEGEGSRIQIAYADAAAGVAETEYRKLEQVQQSRAITEWDVRRAELEWTRAIAQVDIRKIEQQLAAFDADGKEASLAAATNSVERRRLTADFPGIVVETYRREGEWVQAGEPILRLMNFETMVVSGKVDATAYHPHELENRRVTVEVDLARGETAQFQGEITHVSQILDGQNNRITVEAEVANRQIGGHWLLRHAVFAKMTIHMN